MISLELFRTDSYPGVMLKEDMSARPNIYQVLKEACSMQGREVPIKDVRPLNKPSMHHGPDTCRSTLVNRQRRISLALDRTLPPQNLPLLGLALRLSVRTPNRRFPTWCR